MPNEQTASDTFPVVWDDPANAELTWQFDITHTPDVVTPLGYDLFYGPFITGFGSVRICQQNYYVYVHSAPWPERGVGMEVEVERLIRGARRFRDQVVPEVTEHAERYRLRDFDALPDAELVRELDALPALRLRQGELHEVSLTPYGIGMTHLIDTYKELVADDELAAVRLVQGHGNKSTEAGEALWRLSRVAASIPAVRERLLGVDMATAKDGLAALQRELAAAPFLEALSAFLEAYGWRSDLFELATPAWAEDPSIPLCQLRAYLELDGYDPAVERARLDEERDAFVRETLAPLAPEAQARLRAAIEGGRHVVCLQEDHNFYIDQRAATLPRRLILAAGRRLVAKGALADAADVFYLRADELRAALEGAGDAASAVERHKAAMARWAQVTPPPTIGAPPAAGEDGTSPGGVLSRGERPNELTGNGASSGVARGPARVLMSLTEADRLRPGDVLVSRTTMPAWTPLFAVATAVVTEAGGVLSHAAVVAREYGIPAVLAVTNATRLIPDGRLIEVDGDRGVVRLLA